MSVLDKSEQASRMTFATALYREHDEPFTMACGPRCDAVVEVAPSKDLTWDILKGDGTGREFLSLGWACPSCGLRHNVMAFDAAVYLYYRGLGIDKSPAVLGAIGHVFEGDWVTYSAELYLERAEAWGGYAGVDC